VFTGSIEETGTVRSAERRGELLLVAVSARKILVGLPPGGSIAVNGCCLTAVAVAPDAFTCELTAETLQRTAFEARLTTGARVNLERPMRADGRFDGHIVQGHVDGTGRVDALDRDGDDVRFSVQCGPEIARYLVPKGSVAIDGVSLTVVGVSEGGFDVALIPHTLAETNLGDRRPGDRVNLEADVLGKYVVHYLERTRAGRD
jgi:riboflavin synthase